MALFARFRPFYLSFLALLCWVTPGMGANSSRPDLDLSRAAYKRGNFREATESARRAADALAKSSDHALLADVLEQFALSSWAAGQSLAPGTLQAATECLELRKRLHPESTDPLARAYLVEARIHRTLAHFPEARADIDSALALAGPGTREAVLLQRAALEMNTGRYPAADSILTQAEGVLGAPDSDPGDQVRVQVLRGQFLQLTARYVQAESVLTRAVDEADKVFGAAHPETANPMQVLANVYLSTGRYDQSRNWYQRALTVRKNALGEEHPDVANSINGLGVVARRLERYDEAIRAYTQAAAIARKTLGANHPNTIQFDNNLAGVYYNLGLYEEAFPVVERGLAARIQIYGKDHPDVAQSFQNLGTLKEKRGDLEGAAADLGESRRIFSETMGPDGDQTLYVTNLLAMAQAERGRLAEADSLERDLVARASARPGPPIPGLGYWIADLALIERERHQPKDALATYGRALDIVKTNFGEDHPQAAEVLFEMAIVNAQLGNLNGAMDNALHAETIGRERLALMAEALPERLALEYAGERPQGLPLAASLLASGAAGDSVALVWDKLVRSRALIQDAVAFRSRQLASPAQGPLRDLAAQHASLLSDYANALVNGVRGPEEAAALDSLRSALEKAEIELVAQSSEFKRAETRRHAGFKDIQQSLPTHAAMAALLRYDRLIPDRWSGPLRIASVTEYAAFLLPAGGEKPRFLRLGSAASLDSLTAAWRALAGRPPSNGQQENEAPLAQLGSELGRRIWTPVSEACGQANQVYWVLDGDLALLNPYAWIGTDGRYLVESGPAMHLLDAERDLLQSSEQQKGSGLLALGDPDFNRTQHGSEALSVVYRGEGPDCQEFASHKWERLPGSATEIKDIAGLCATANPNGEPVDILSGSRATETLFKTKAPGRRMIHIATHGFYLEDQCTPAPSGERGMGGLVAESSGHSVPAPASKALTSKQSLRPALRSGLIFAGANVRSEVATDDGVLTAEEIGAIDLSSVEWAVISACATGVGTVKPGEGILGLRRAFETAGARTLITSLWAVEDKATQSWMDALYQARMTDRLSTIEAVRKASLSRLEARRSQHLSTHPFYWAAFVAYGDWH
jgi:CHAT domain-containing protein/tetratricopeptide (TPR) repeat protein